MAQVLLGLVGGPLKKLVTIVVLGTIQAQAYDPSVPAYQDPVVIEIKAEGDANKLYTLLEKHYSSYLKESKGQVNLLNIAATYVRAQPDGSKKIAALVEKIREKNPSLFLRLVGEDENDSMPIDALEGEAELYLKILKALPQAGLSRFLRKYHYPLVTRSFTQLYSEDQKNKFEVLDFINKKKKELSPFFTF